MARKEDLFDLIHSLNRSEKRHFRLFSSAMRSGANYLRLFDVIDRQNIYDEKAIRKEFAGEAFVKQLHVTKNYLRNAILKSLRAYHGRISRSAELKEMLRNVEIFFSKELYGQCRAEIARAEQQARTYQLTAGLLEVQAWKRKLDQTESPRDYPALRTVLKEEQETLTALQNTNAYWHLAAILTDPQTPDPDDSHLELLANPDHALTREARVLHHNLAYYKGINEGNVHRAKAELYKLIAYLEESPAMLAEDPASYVSTINNLVSYLVFQKKNEEALELIGKAKAVCAGSEIPNRNKNLLKQILRMYNIELEICRDSKTFIQRTDFIQNTEEFIGRNTGKIPKDYLISFWFQLAHIHFMRNDPGRSLHWLNLILNTRFEDIRIDLQVQARMLNLMVHLEQQNLFVLRYFVDNTKRFLRKTEGIRPFEQILLDFFISIDSVPLLEYRGKFSTLRDQLFPKKGTAMIPAEVLDYINYKAWIEQKINP